MRIRTRVILGVASLGVLVLSACGQAPLPVAPAPAPAPAAAPAPAPAPAPATPPVPQQQFPGQGQGQIQGQGSGNSYQSPSQVEASLGRRSPERGYWPPAIQQGPSQLGNVLYDGYGFPLYLYKGDSTKPPASHCEDECTQQFFPVLVNEQITYQNVDPSHISSIVRVDGTKQLTYYSHPVYRYINDLNSWQITAHGFQESWYAIGVDGSIAGSH